MKTHGNTDVQGCYSTASSWKQPEYPWMDEWSNKAQNI